MRWVPLIAAVLLAGCAHYAQVPLESDPGVLASPVASVLAREAAAIRRPFLTPTTIDLAAPLDPNAIATLAVIANPDLKAQRVRAGVSDAQLFAARLLPDPTLSVGASKVVSGPDPLIDLANALGLDIQALRTRGVRIAAARAQAGQVRLDLAWAEWQTAGQARLQAARTQGLERRAALAAASRDAARSLADRTLRAAGRGDLPPDQVQAARLSAFNAAELVRTAERDLAAARFELTRLIGLPPSYPLTLAPVAAPPPPPDAAVLFAFARDTRSDLAALREGYAAQEATVHRAVLEQFPTLALTINANRDSAGNALVGPAIDFTLPLWNRNRGGIAVERATREALKTEYDARLFQTRAEIAAAVGGIAVAHRQRVAALHDLPAVQQFAVASRRAANRGDLAPATAEIAEQALRDNQTLVAQADQDIAEQTIALELLTGAPREDWPQ
ncbi:TolC family protein [Sphingomonas oligophenolica]|uniref:TolC family protein n=1 Tax=Sphingomonas oligophenolica TaxID=301154 RepID=A0A502CNA8_9SPHN|nr:TolC family protein [Sphingomonas oligophenolica]TPG14313.1 TolC family protein [Sphingomonas oligophenolica]